MSKSITIIILLFLVSPALFAQKNIRLQLHVRAFEGNHPLTELEKKDFKLTINGQQREIPGAVKKTASLGKKTGFLGRNFILSLHIADYGKQVQKAVSYFISEILDSTDTLILLSPLKIYKINVTPNKEKMIREIEKLVKEDCHIYKKNMTASRKNLENQLNRMKQLFMGGVDDQFLITSYKMIGRFLSTFPSQFLNFRDHFLFPDTNKYRKALDSLGNREGERWWVHIQQGDIFGILTYIQAVARRISAYCNSNSLANEAFSSSLAQLEKELQLADSFPAAQLANIFAEGDVRYNSIIRGSQKGRGLKTGNNFISLLERTLSQISRDSGGKTVRCIDPEQGLKEIHNHWDYYYQLTYRFNDKIEEKKIHLTAAAPGRKKVTLFYNAHFSEKRIQSLTRYLSTEKIKITGFSLDKKVIKFSITSIAFHKKELFGLVKIRVELFDQAGNSVYRSENTLRTSRKSIIVSLPVPVKGSGKFKLVITACDRVGNQLVSFERFLTEGTLDIGNWNDECQRSR